MLAFAASRKQCCEGTLTTEAQAGKVPEAEAQQIAGQVNWVRARAIRDHAFAKSHHDGKGIPETFDPQYNEKFRAFLFIPNAEARAEGLVALRTAVTQLGSTDRAPKELYAEVLKESVRNEVILPTIQWAFVEPALRKALELNPKDPRANYYLALFEYDQPASDNVPTPIAKKLPDRIEKARQYLEVAKQTPGSQFWRIAGLEAEILDWPLRTAIVRKLKPEDVALAEKSIDDFFFAPGGMIEVIRKGEKLVNLGRPDSRGLASLLVIAMERAVADARRPTRNLDRVWAVYRTATELAERLAADPAMKPFVPDVVAALVQSAESAQPVLARADAVAWNTSTTRLNAFLGDVPDALRSRPAAYIHVVNIATFDAMQAAQAKDRTRAKILGAIALKAAEDGLKAAEETGRPISEIDEFRALVAERSLLAGTPIEQIEPLVAKLRESANANWKQAGQLLEAAIAERQGRLEKARTLLQPLATDKSNLNRQFRTNALLFRVSRATGEEVTSLSALNEMEAKFASEQLTPAAVQWAAEYGVEPGSIAADRAIGYLGLALQSVTHYAQKNPGQPIPTKLVEGNEKKALALVEKSPRPSPADRKARLALAHFYQATNRRNLAESELAELANEYPDSVDVLRARCLLLAASTNPEKAWNPNGVAAADTLIRGFLKSHPDRPEGSLFLIEWYVSTDRVLAAINFRHDPANSSLVTDPAVDWVLANIPIPGNPGEPLAGLEWFPLDSDLDASVILQSATRQAELKPPAEAFARENPGLARIYEGAMQASSGNPDKAIRAFASAVEFTRVGPAARIGLQRAFAASAKVDPLKTREIAIRLADEMPNEPASYLAAAAVALRLGEVGRSGDNWAQTKTAWAALNRWEPAAQRTGTSRGEITLTRIHFHLLAGNPEEAKREAANALARDPSYTPAIIALCEVSLLPPQDAAKAREWFEQALKEDPTNPRLPYLDAQIKAAAGDWSGAAAVYQRLIGHGPWNPTPYRLLVETYEAAGQKEDALKWALAWHARLPDDEKAIEKSVSLLAVSNLAGAIKTADEFVAGRVADTRKQFAKLLTPEQVDKALEKVRGNALLATAAGFLRAQLLDEAETRANEASKYLPGDERTALVLGEVALGRKSWDAALSIYRGLLKQNRRHLLAAHKVVWILLEHKNDPAGALLVVEELRKAGNGLSALDADRLPADLLDTIGAAYLKLNQTGKFGEMQTLFQNAARRYPNDPRMFLRLGEAQVELGERSKAIESLDAALRLASVKNALSNEQNKTVTASAQAARKRLRD